MKLLVLYCACEAGEVGPNVTNNRKKTAKTIAMMGAKYIDCEKHCFLAVILKHEVSIFFSIHNSIC